MEKYIIWNIIILCLAGLLAGAGSCPTTCKCRGPAVRCATGFTAFPTGLDAISQYLTIAGTPAQPNSIPSLKKSDFAGVTSLSALVILFSGIQGVVDGTFSDLNKLKDLSLADNNIQSLKANAFQGLSQLRTLDISGNKNCQFDNTLFMHILNLEELNLGGMGIRQLDSNFFHSLTKLKVLKLYTNELKHVHQDLLAPLTNLITLDINGNHLLGLPSELKSKFETMTSVHMSENPWQCNCQLVWLRELPEAFVSSRTDGNNIVCNGPRKLRFQSFVTIPDKDFVCIPPNVIRCEQSRYSLDINNMLVISCEFEGDPVPQIKWKRPDGFEIVGRNTASGKYQIYENGTLVINSVGLEDDGDWAATAFNATAHDDENINVHVIVTTTSTTTTSTTTQTTPTTKSTTTKSTTTVKSTISSTPTTPSSTIIAAITSKPATQKPSGVTNNIVTVLNPAYPGNSDKIIVIGDKETIIKEGGGINYGLLAAAAAGGGTLVGIIAIIAMCCKKKQPHEKNKVSPFEDDFEM